MHNERVTHLMERTPLSTNQIIGAASVNARSMEITCCYEAGKQAFRGSVKTDDLEDEFFDEDEYTETDFPTQLIAERPSSNRSSKARDKEGHDNLKTMSRQKMQRMTRNVIRGFYQKNNCA